MRLPSKQLHFPVSPAAPLGHMTESQPAADEDSHMCVTGELCVLKLFILFILFTGFSRQDY